MQETVNLSETPNRRARRSYTKEFKARLVAECTTDDRSIAQVAMEHQINANLIHKWSRQLKHSIGQAMVPVAMREGTITATDRSRIEVVFDERETWRVAMWSCTTDPGLYFLNSEKMGDRAGTAVLIPNQYRRCWKVGKHGKDKYPALVQNGMPFKVWRDHNKDGSLDRSGKVYDDVTGLNCHKAYEWGEGKVIGKNKWISNWSAGCQVSEVSYAHDYILMPMARKQVKKGVGSTFTYTLFDSKDFSDM